MRKAGQGLCWWYRYRGRQCVHTTCQLSQTLGRDTPTLQPQPARHTCQGLSFALQKGAAAEAGGSMCGSQSRQDCQAHQAGEGGVRAPHVLNNCQWSNKGANGAASEHAFCKVRCDSKRTGKLHKTEVLGSLLSGCCIPLNAIWPENCCCTVALNNLQQRTNSSRSSGSSSPAAVRPASALAAPQPHNSSFCSRAGVSGALCNGQVRLEITSTCCSTSNWGPGTSIRKFKLQLHAGCPALATCCLGAQA